MFLRVSGLFINSYVYTCTYTQNYLRTHIHTYILTYTLIYVYIILYTYIYILYIHIYIHIKYTHGSVQVLPASVVAFVVCSYSKPGRQDLQLAWSTNASFVGLGLRRLQYRSPTHWILTLEMQLNTKNLKKPCVHVQDWSAKCDHVAAGQYAPVVDELKARTFVVDMVLCCSTFFTSSRAFWATR